MNAVELEAYDLEQDVVANSSMVQIKSISLLETYYDQRSKSRRCN